MPDERPSPQLARSPWTYEEIVLVCQAVAANGWVAVSSAGDDRVRELSDLLRRASPGHANASTTFRNPNGVTHKMGDLVTARPGYRGGRKKGGRTTVAVAAAFDAEPARMGELADAIRATIVDPEPVPALSDVDEDQTFDEGRTFERRHLARERNPEVRRRRIALAWREQGHVGCEACGFDFAAVYGERGEGFIECHHRQPLSVAGPRATALRDLALLCSNCHRMIHRYRPWLTVEQLAALVERPRQ